MISLILAAALAAGVRHEHITPTYTVKRSGGGLGFWVEETAVLAGVRPSKRTQGEPLFWVVEQRRADRDIGKYAAGGRVLEYPGWTIKHEWIASRRCPAVVEVIHQLQSLAAARAQADARAAAQIEAAARIGIDQLDINIPNIPPSDTPEVSVAAVGDDAGRTKMSDYRGPVSRWWLEAGKNITTCWQAAPPLVNGKPVASLITGPWVIRYP